MNRKLTLTAACGLACGLAVLVGGCADGKKKAPTETTRERQDRALRDPFGYKPDWSDTSVGGGDTADLDKDGLRNDLKKVLDP